ncbi:MAG: gamma-glutamylcyclotransferase [Solirubrobacterales bacterium]|nr:gamma-glutamylcyclotransferase [Solirubrobacterales bacterium]
MGDDAPVAVFAYGSLVAAASATVTLDRPPLPVWLPGHAKPATLRGWRRRFSQARQNRTCEKTFARDDDGSVPQIVLGLNVERTGAADDTVNGLLIEVTGTELLRLDGRELRYDRVEVGEEIEAPGERAGSRPIYTYTAKPSHFAPVPPPGAVVLRSYVTAVEEAFAELGSRELASFHETTGSPPSELIDAHLIRDRIPAGNPRDW